MRLTEASAKMHKWYLMETRFTGEDQSNMEAKETVLKHRNNYNTSRETDHFIANKKWTKKRQLEKGDGN